MPPVALLGQHQRANAAVALAAVRELRRLGLLRSGDAFVTPTGWAGETVLRICVVNPRTTVADIEAIIDSLRADP